MLSSNKLIRSLLAVLVLLAVMPTEAADEEL